MDEGRMRGSLGPAAQPCLAPLCSPTCSLLNTEPAASADQVLVARSGIGLSSGSGLWCPDRVRTRPLPLRSTWGSGHAWAAWGAGKYPPLLPVLWAAANTSLLRRKKDVSFPPVPPGVPTPPPRAGSGSQQHPPPGSGLGLQFALSDGGRLPDLPPKMPGLPRGRWELGSPARAALETSSSPPPTWGSGVLGASPGSIGLVLPGSSASFLGSPTSSSRSSALRAVSCRGKVGGSQGSGGGVRHVQCEPSCGPVFCVAGSSALPQSWSHLSPLGSVACGCNPSLLLPPELVASQHFLGHCYMWL